MNSFFIYHVYSVREIMFLVIIACIPSICTKYYFFGSSTLIQILFSIIIALILEVIILKIRCKKIKINIQDNSSIVIAVLFTLSIPCLIPWWIIIIGLFFSVIIAKHLYGGIGQNIFNPAMVGYAVLLVSFPIYMNNWSERDLSLSYLDDIKKSVNVIFLKDHEHDINYTYLNVNLDAFTGATPLNTFKIKSHTSSDFVSKENSFKNININVQTSWKYMNISFLLGGFFLLFKRIICWRIPISFLSSLSLCSIITYCYSKEVFLSPFVHLFSGGTMMCAFFIATDPVTAPCTHTGKILFGIIIGCLVWIIRNYSDYPDAIAFSILFGNMIVPLIDYCIKSSGYGHNK